MSRLTWLLTASLLVAGCGRKAQHTVCMGGTAGPLASGAALFELDDYGTTAHCNGALLDSDAVPVASRTFGAGAAIAMPLQPGAHTLVLLAWADAGATMLVGTGCTEATVGAGDQVCIDLTLSPAPDGGLGTPDFAGCTLDTVDNCGACGQRCDSINSQGASCSGAACSYSACNMGRLDCNATPPNLDGCECEGTGCCNGACQTKHSDGLAEYFYDCIALATYDATQAMKAAAAWDPAGSIGAVKTYSDNKGNAEEYLCNQSTAHNACGCWSWGGTGNLVGPGRVVVTNGKPSNCFFALNSTYPVWN